jgi:hypothetical protein
MMAEHSFSYETVIPQDGEIFVTQDEKVGIYRGDKAKKKKLNTPVKSLKKQKKQTTFTFYILNM